ncbi:glycosyltransferase family 2 protein [Candidatus Dojkabacteria bacterium]|nr:glycosyltransferase family 2 protein [Candidatus Dojkabacteria bacterium]
MKRIRPYNTERKSFFWYKIIPGIITVVILTSPLWTSLLGIYEALIIYLAFLATYILYKAVQHSIASVLGYKKMVRDKKRDWSKDLLKIDFDNLESKKDLPNDLSQIYHLFFYPIYKESYSDLKKGIESIVNQDYPYPKRIIFVAAVEERAGPEQKEIVKKLKKEYQDKVYGFWDYYHPENIEGEIKGDACSNLRWAARHASKDLQSHNIDSRHVIFTKADADTRFHKKFFSALTYTYITADKRYQKFYSPAVIIYSNNIWKVPGLVRLFSMSLTLSIVAEWVYEKRLKQSFTCYSANFHLLERIDFWDPTTGAEDTYFYWNAFLHLNGDFQGECFFLPVTMDAVEGTDLLSSLTSLYKQQLRWGWGVILMPIAIQGMLWNKKIPVSMKISKFALLARIYNFTITMSTLLSFAMPVLNLINNELEYSSIAYLLPKTVSYMMMASLLFQIPSKYYLWRYYGSPPKEKSLLFKIWWWGVEHFLMFINIWTYYLIPRLHAQYEVTLGKQRKKFFISVEGRQKKINSKSKTLP